MKSFLAIILSPSAALAAQAVMYSLVTPSCSQQARVYIHLAAAVGLLVAVVLGVLAYSDWSTHAAELSARPDGDGADPRQGRRFLAVLGTAIAALSVLVILCMWIGTWLLSPCLGP